MTRRKLADLVKEGTAESMERTTGLPPQQPAQREAVGAEQPEAEEAPVAAAGAWPGAETLGRESRARSEVLPSYGSPASPRRPMPKYLRLQRKEARLREEQLDALASLSRRLNRQKRGRGERITENTLLRVAVDLLLTQEDRLYGDTEEELNSSAGL